MLSLFFYRGTCVNWKATEETKISNWCFVMFLCTSELGDHWVMSWFPPARDNAVAGTNESAFEQWKLEQNTNICLLPYMSHKRMVLLAYTITTIPVVGDRNMMTSSNGNIFRVTGHLCGEFTGPRRIPHTKASDAELWCFLSSALNKRLSKQWWSWWFETLSRPLWRHYNEHCISTYISDILSNQWHIYAW